MELTSIVIAAFLASGALGAIASVLGSWAERGRAVRLKASLEAEAEVEAAHALNEVTRLEQIRTMMREPVPTPDPHAGEDSPAAPEPWAGMIAPGAIRLTASDFRLSAPSEIGGISQAVNAYYKQALFQAQVWFVASLVAAVGGLVLVAWEVIQAADQPILAASVRVVAGVVTTAVGALFYRQADATRRYAAELLKTTQADRKVDAARALLAQIDDPDQRRELTGQMAMHFAGVRRDNVRRAPRAQVMPAQDRGEPAPPS